MSASKTILVVDDERLVRGMTAAMLQDEDYAVLEAGSTDEALALVRSDPSISLVLTDINMPGTDGFQLAATLAAEQPELRIVFASGHDELNVEEKAGSRPVLLKPYSIVQLFDTIARELERS